MSNNVYSFDKSKDIGKNGEKTIIEYLKQIPEIESVVDVSDNPEYFDSDIDVIVKIKGNPTHRTIEIKTDTYNSGNIFFELISNNNKNTLGCSLVSKADFLFYYFINSNELYIIDLPKYRTWVLFNISMFKCKVVKSEYFMSCGILVPKKVLEKHFKKFKKIKFSIK